jgi:NTE family protein
VNEMPETDNTLRIGLALSGGGTRGLAHIGVLKALEGAGVQISGVSGTSMGGFIGAAYACGLSPAELEAEAVRFSRRRHLLPLLDRTLTRRGLLEGNRLMDYFRDRAGDLTFDHTRLPLALVAVDLNTGRVIVLREGSVVEAVRATIALPGLFSPVERDGLLLVDGGLLANLPTTAARSLGMDLIVGVDVGTNERALSSWYDDQIRSRFVPDALVDLFHVLLQSLMIMTREANRHNAERDRPELLIHPDISGGVTGLSGFDHAAEIIAAGERTAEAALPQLQALLDSANPLS